MGSSCVGALTTEPPRRHVPLHHVLLDSQQWWEIHRGAGETSDLVTLAIKGSSGAAET